MRSKQSFGLICLLFIAVLGAGWRFAPSRSMKADNVHAKKITTGTWEWYGADSAYDTGGGDWPFEAWMYDPDLVVPAYYKVVGGTIERSYPGGKIFVRWNNVSGYGRVSAYSSDSTLLTYMDVYITGTPIE
ncbi:hypothetical protein LQ567_07335 [Niabella pedocola]|uniref:Uncharacterized protein n=1 Tax=Niabella pedocola TaxID=1752077 RepID=A0ABS8PRS1_9BACT|nr:hypothetical protein [Niabella pedocola]MCD2422571.1 hypothetical protein [Niabella pedocola]